MTGFPIISTTIKQENLPMREKLISSLAASSIVLLGVGYALANNVRADGKRIVAFSEQTSEIPAKGFDISESKVRRDPPLSNLDKNQSELDWKITNWKRSTLQEQLTLWVNKHYQLGNVFGNLDVDVATVSTPKYPLTFKELIEFEIVDIPQNKGNLKSEFRQKDKLVFYAVGVFEDKDGYLYTTSLESRKSNTDILLITSVGPAIDRDPLKRNLPLEQKHLKSGSPNYISNLPAAKKSRLVVIPYPSAMDQVYTQHGSNPFLASFNQLETGKKYENLDAILVETDKQWRDMNPKAIQ